MALLVVVRSGIGAGQAAVRTSPLVSQEGQPTDSCEALFWALDGRDLVVLGKRWRVEVFSVVELMGRRYVQLSLGGSTQHMLTLRLTPETSVRALIPAVLGWLTRPAASGLVLDVP